MNALCVKIEDEALAIGIPKIELEDLKRKELFAEGGSSRVFKAFFNGAWVAVKALLPDLRQRDDFVKDLHEELQRMLYLRHKNISSLLAYGNLGTSSLFLVVEFCDQGTLESKRTKMIPALHRARAVADALDYIHNDAKPGVTFIHRDLKPENVGLTSSGDVKILDFGLSTSVRKSSEDGNGLLRAKYFMTGQTGSLRYMAPEVAKEEPYNESVDIYSWSMVTWQLLTNKKPFGLLTFEHFLRHVVEDGIRPAMPRSWPAPLRDLLSQCWDPNPDHRPDFKHIKQVLDTILEPKKKGNSTGKKNPDNFAAFSSGGGPSTVDHIRVQRKDICKSLDLRRAPGGKQQAGKEGEEEEECSGGMGMSAIQDQSLVVDFQQDLDGSEGLDVTTAEAQAEARLSGPQQRLERDQGQGQEQISNKKGKKFRLPNFLRRSRNATSNYW